MAGNRIARRAPRSAAITIKGLEEDFSYVEALKTAKERISLDEIGIGSTRLRKAINGGVVIEIIGPNNEEKADILRDIH